MEAIVQGGGLHHFVTSWPEIDRAISADGGNAGADLVGRKQ